MTSGSSHERWLTLREAASRLDVHPKTLRRWADDGEIPCMLTPGGHRRFASSDVSRFVKARHGASVDEGIAAAWAKNALADARNKAKVGMDPEWVGGIHEDVRTKCRRLGRRLVGLAFKYINGDVEKDVAVNAAKDVGREYALVSKGAGLRLKDALQVSMLYGETVVGAALALPEERRVRPETETDLIRRINMLINNVQLAVVEVYDADETDPLPRT